MNAEAVLGAVVVERSPGLAEPRPPGVEPRLSGMYRWAAEFVRPEGAALAGVLLLSLVAVLAGLAQPLLTKALIDDGILAGSSSMVLKVGGAMVALALSALLVGLACRRIHVGASARILHRMRESLFAHVLTLPPDFFSRMRQGDLMTRLEADLGEVQRFAVDSVLSAINSVLTLIGTVVLISFLSPMLALFLAGLMAVNGLVLRHVSPRIRTLSRDAREAGVDVSAFLLEKTSAVKCVQTYGAEDRELARLQQLHRTARDRLLALQIVSYVGGAFPNLVLSLAIIGIFVAGGVFMHGDDALTLGTLVAFATYVQRGSAPLQALMGLYLSWQRVKVGLIRVDELRNMPSAVRDRAGEGEATIERGEIVVAGLDFAYPGRSTKVLDGLDMHVRPGGKVWLRGVSGAGKSTFVDLLHRHLEPDCGALLIDGVDIRKVRRTDLRRRIGIVSQDVVLFAGSLLDNIAYGNPEAGREAVVRAAAIAGVSDFSRRLADGLDTVLGPRGASLSGGERQRIGLARALLIEPQVLIIDEATSGLDGALEQSTLAAIDEAYPNTTRILISHRALDPAMFDQVIDL
ncbi:MAG: ABC transporter ATP-binding protein [Azoarcus sp.]|nr:ABC transporter ATP-binding protein [Azoarcus sp.]